MLISTKYPFPADDGKKVVLSGMVRYFVQRFGSQQVSYVAINDRRNPSMPDDHFPCRLTWMLPPHPLEQFVNVLRSVMGRSRRSLQEAVTYSARIALRLDELVKKERPDLLVLDTIRVGQYFVPRSPGVPFTVLYMDHLLFPRFRAMSAFSANYPEAALDPIGTFRRFVPRLARSVLRSGIVQRALFGFEARAVEGREVASAALFDRCLLLTDSDVDELRDRSGCREVRAIKPLLFESPCTASRRYDGAARFVLCGSLRHPANRAALVQFFRSGMAPALKQLPGLEIRVIGAGVDDELRALARPFGAHVHFDGYVDDLGAAFASTCALLVPLLFGYGLKIKMLAAMYHGLPIISTSEGAEGLPLRDGKDFILENDLTQFSTQMVRLRDIAANKLISDGAMDTFRRHYSQDIIYSEYDRIFAI
jgi:hypothetical protein